MINDRVISMPDKWEYPWYAAWIAFPHHRAHGVNVDSPAAELMLRAFCLRGRQIGLRAELWRCEPARARLGHGLSLSRGAGASRAGDVEFMTLFRQADGQLHLVGEP
jgi:hypothetical protein